MTTFFSVGAYLHPMVIPVPRAVLVLLLSLLAAPMTLAAGREIAPRAIEPVPSAGEPDVAYAGGRFLTIWIEPMGSIGTPVKGALADSAGRRLSSTPFVVLPERAFSMDLVGAGDRFVLFWRDYDGVIHMTSLDLDGRVVSDRTFDLSPLEQRVSAAWNGHRFLLATSFSGAYLLDRDGNIEHGPIDVKAFDPAIVPRPEGFVLVGAHGNVVVHTLSSEGALTTMTLDSPTGTWPYELGAGEPAATLRGDGSVLVVWAYGNSLFGETELRSAVIAADGSASSRSTLLAARGAIVEPLHLLPSAEGATLLMRYGRNLRTMRVDANGHALTEPSIPGPELPAVAVTDDGVRAYVAGSIDIRAQAVLVGVDGAISEPQPLAFMPVTQSAPALGSGAGLHVALWEEGEYHSPRARTAALSRDGTTLRMDTIADFVLVSDPVWNGTEYLAVYYVAERLLGVRLDEYGEVIDSPGIANVAGSWSRPGRGAVVTGWTGTQWMAAWGNDRDIMIAFISTNGVASDPLAFPIDLRPFAEARPLAMALTATGPLFLWKDDQDLFVSRLTSDGEPIGTPLQLPCDPANAYAMATSGEDAVVLADNQAVALRTSGDALEITATRTFRGAGDVVWDGREYVLVYRMDRDVWTLELVRFDGALNPRGEPRFVHTLPPAADETASIVAYAFEPALIGIQEGDATSGPRAVLYREDELLSLPPLPSRPVAVQTRQLSDGRYETTWEAPLTGPVDGYQIVTTRPDGYVSDFYVSGDTRRVVTQYGNVIVRASNANGLSEIEPIRRRAVRR